VFVTKFFLKIKIIDFSNIETTIKQRVFNFSFIILVKKINKLIKSLLNGKALRLDSILNKIFKVIALIIVKNLVKAANYCFFNEIILKSFKIFIIVVLCKERKKDYSLLSSYKLIAFKNILVKILKKHVVNIIFEVAEKYKLFF